MLICFDTETPTKYAEDGINPPVCLTWSPDNEKGRGRIAVGEEMIDLWDAWSADPSISLVAHNAPFDCCVMAKASAVRAGTYTLPGFGPAFERVFAAYDAGRIVDTIPRQRLIDIARGRQGDDTQMSSLAKRHLSLDMSDDKRMPKEWKHLLGTPVQSWPTEARAATPWRYKYGLLRGVPLADWPDEPKRYACEDPVITWGIYDWQVSAAKRTFGGEIVNEREQTRAMLDLHLHSLTGFRTDRPRVQRILEHYQEIETVCSDLLVVHCALCGDPVVEMPRPEAVKRALEAGADPGDPRIGHCPKCRERCTLVRVDVKWREREDGKPRISKGVVMRERRKRVKDRKAAQRMVWLTLGAGAPLTKTARETGLAKSQATVATDAEVMIRVAATRASGREDLLPMGDVLRAAGDGTLQELIQASPLPVVNAVRLYSRAQKYRTAFLAPLDTDRRVRTSYQVCKDTGRTSSRVPSVHQYPRPDDAIPADLDIRSCILPDTDPPMHHCAIPGLSEDQLFLVCDFGQIELVGLAHVLNVLGRANGRGEDYQSSLAVAINNGMDGHVMVAAEVLHSDYETVLAAYKSAKSKKKRGEEPTTFEKSVLRWRQVGKIQNYGAAGGMGAVTFVTHAAKQDAVISLEESRTVRQAWMRAWSPDIEDYFRAMSQLTEYSGRADITQLYSGRKRGRCTFTQCCNSMFQALCADGFKRAMHLTNDAMFRQPGSPLYGCRPVLEVHDELVMSCARSRAKAAAAELSRLMIAGMAEYIDDIVISADCDIMERWGKG